VPHRPAISSPPICHAVSLAWAVRQ